MKQIMNPITGLIDIVLDTVDQADTRGMGYPMIAIYELPEEYPDKCVARLFDRDQATNLIIIRDSLEELKEDVEKTGLIFVERGPEDVPALVGVYI